jgi:hypothetical protein
MKKTTLFLAILTAGILAASDSMIITPEQLTNSKNLTAKEGNILEVKGMTTAYSKKVFDFDPAKTYSVSADFRQISGKAPAVIFFGFQPLDKKNRQILTPHTQIIAKTDTVLTATAEKGTKVIEVKDASKWLKGSTRLAIYTDPELKDLPNYSIIYTTVSAMEKSGENWKVSLSHPLPLTLKSGTAVRQHRAGGAMYPAAPAVRISRQWKTFSGKASGKLNGPGYSGTKFPVGTVKVQMLLFVNYGQKDAVTEIRNLEFKAE